jgi:hypothetical protein
MGANFMQPNENEKINVIFRYRVVRLLSNGLLACTID